VWQTANLFFKVENQLMSNSFKHKAIVASLAAVFAISTMSVAQANAFSDTTQAAGTAAVTVLAASTNVSYGAQTFTLTESTAGAFTASTAGTSFANLRLRSSTPGDLAVYAGAAAATSLSTATKLTASSNVAIAGAKIVFDGSVAASTGDTLSLLYRGDTWLITLPTSGVLGTANVFKNGVSVASGIPLDSTKAGAVIRILAAQLKTAYGASFVSITSTDTNTDNLTLYDNTAYLWITAAATTGATGLWVDGTATKFVPLISSTQSVTNAYKFTQATGATTIAVTNAAGAAGQPVLNVGSTSATAIDITAAAGPGIAVPFLVNASTTPATVTLSNIATATTPAAAATISVLVETASTAAGVSKASSTQIGTAAALKTTITTPSAVSIAPGGSVTVGTITFQENLPASMANNAVVTLTLPTGYTWSTTNAVVSATSAGGTTTVGTLAATTNTLTYTVAAAGASATFPTKVTITGLSVTAPSSAATGSTTNVTVATAGSVTGGDTPFLNIQGGSASTSLNGTVQNVYTFRNYASGVNGGALTAKVNLTESLAGTLLANTALNVTLGNAVAGQTTSGVTTVSTGPTFANSTGAVQLSTATAINTAAGYSTAGAVFSPSAFSYNITTASTSALSNVLTLGNLTIGPVVGPVTVATSSNVTGALPTITVANATNATNTSITGAVPSAALAGAAVTLPSITVTESAAGAIATQVGGIGQVSFLLTNGTWDVAASQSATWCGAALPASNITGSSSNTLTVNLSSVSTAPCALVLNGKATAALTAAPGSAISVKVNSSLSDTGQATRQELQVATVSTTPPDTGKDTFPTTQTVTTAATPSGLIFTPTFTPNVNNQSKKADIYVIAYYQGVFLYKKKTPAGCAGWTGFSPQTGGIPQAYETGVTLGTSAYQFGNINDCDVTALKGVSYYIGYGVGSSIFGNAQTWNNMLANGTFSNNAVFLTN